MAPRWLHRDEDKGKRASVFSSLTTTIRLNKELQSPEPASTSTFSSFPPLNESINDMSVDQTHDVMTRPRNRSLSRKRMSFFGRNPAPLPEDVEPMPKITSPVLESAPVHEIPKSTFEDDDDDDEPRSRPLSRRRTSKYFGSRGESISRWSRRDDKTSRPSTAPSDRGQQSEEEFYRNLKKNSISSPFNFQHITHTQQQQLTGLDSVGDSDLSAQFRAVSTQQIPQKDLRGIKADDIEETQRAVKAGASRPVSRHHSRPSSPTGFKFDNEPLPTTMGPRPGTLQTSHSTSELPQDGHRPVTLSRSISLADLAAERRILPTSIHPALRGLTESVSSPELEQSSAHPTPLVDAGRFLDVVPEELESTSAPSSPFKPLDRRMSHSSHFMQILAQQSVRDPSLETTMSTSVQEIDSDSQWKDSLPSLWSGDSWEDDVDYCYEMGMEAEPEEYDFDWDQRTNSYSLTDPRDSVMPPSRKTFTQDHYADVSPRTSMANHERNKSSMALNGLLPAVNTENLWDPTRAFERPRIAPDTPDMGTPHMSSCFELPPLSLHQTSQPVKTPIFDEMYKCRSDVLKAMEIQSRPRRSSNGHARSKSEGSSPVSHKNQLSHRWTYMPPYSIRESVVSPTSGVIRPAEQSRPASYGASMHPPPTAPLPPLPHQRKSAPVNFSHKRISAALTSSSQPDTYMRRPRTVEDRSILQAAGRTVQRSRPTTPPLRACRSTVNFNQSSIRNLMERSVSNLELTDDVFGNPMPFPAWI